MRTTRRQTAHLLALLLVPLGACASSDLPPCQSSADCGATQLCRLGRCVAPRAAPRPEAPDLPGPREPGEGAPAAEGPAPEDQSAEGWPGDMGAVRRDVQEAGPDQGPASGPSACAGARPRPGELILNEVLVNVPRGEAGDANADGERDAWADEFVELVNISERALDVDGVKITNGDVPKATLPALCLEPGGAIVIFGGPAGEPPAERGGTLWLRARARFGFSNSAGRVRLLDVRGRELFDFTYEDAPEASYTLSPELTGGAFMSHEALGAPFSPGTCASGRPLSSGCPGPDPEGLAPEGSLPDMGS